MNHFGCSYLIKVPDLSIDRPVPSKLWRKKGVRFMFLSKITVVKRYMVSGCSQIYSKVQYRDDNIVMFPNRLCYEELYQ